VTDHELRKVYDRLAPTFGVKRNPRYDVFRNAILDWFAAHVGIIGPEIVDLGAGAGHESLFLKDRGLDPLAVDFSANMVAECRAKGLRAEIGDFTRLSLPAESFAGALLSFSLLHVPSAAAPGVVADVVRRLKPGGTLLVLLFEGIGEGPREQEAKTLGTARWFTYYDAQTLRALLPSGVEVTREWRLDISPRPTLGIAATRTSG
jgi:ubiquinone/menaquinone biosynthesis C-methylase UbiE